VGPQPRYLPGSDDTYQMYGRGWANVSNTPFRFFKRWTHEGGVASPFIVHWPAGLSDRAGTITAAPHYLPDFLPTVLEATGGSYPDDAPLRPEGVSMLRSWRGGPGPEDRSQFYEHIGNAAVRRGKWKLVREYPADWELYDVDADPTELSDVAGGNPDVVRELAREWSEWAARCGVVPRERILELARWGLAVRAW
jgi:arylsulfatase A-like enzyme